jgi:hypothetical protein
MDEALRIKNIGIELGAERVETNYLESLDTVMAFFNLNKVSIGGLIKFMEEATRFGGVIDKIQLEFNTIFIVVYIKKN